MGCFTSVKVMMIVFNLIIFFAGASLVAIGIYVFMEGGSFIKLLAPFMRNYLHANVPVFMVCLGLVLIMLGLLGSCGAEKKSKCLLIMFFSIIMIISISEVAAGVIVVNYSQAAETFIRVWAIPKLKNQYGKDAAFTDLWNSTMTSKKERTRLKCCGFTNYTDFSESYYYSQNDLLYPPTCCRTPVGYPCVEENALFSHVVGCYKEIVRYICTKILFLSAVAIGIAGVELIVMGLSIYLYCRLDDEATST